MKLYTKFIINLIMEDRMSYNEDLGYVIVKSSDKSGYAFLADRNRQKDKWWTSKLSEAISFTSQIAANNQCSKLKFGNPRVEPRINFHR